MDLWPARISPHVVLPVVRELLLTDSLGVLQQVQDLVTVQLIEEDHDVSVLLARRVPSNYGECDVILTTDQQGPARLGGGETSQRTGNISPGPTN